ncbi:MAG: hypothetical protein VB086_00610 [Clostridiaceae bacterium]|nr:hypothetical protein [Clostridiaceae bacterium]
MEYQNVVSRIIAAEHSAKEIAQEMKDREPELEAELQKDLDGIRQDAMEQAKRRVAEVQRLMNIQVDKDLAHWDTKLKQSMDRVENANRKYRQNWVDTLFSMIVKETP